MTRILFALFASGFCSILFQEVWTKKAGLLFGHTTYAVTAVVSVFMLGLALGNALAPRILRSLRRPIFLYAIAETAVALAGLGIAFLPWSDLPAGAATKAAVIVLLLLPTALMGLTLPAVVAAVPLPRASARLYAANTLGAAAGALTGAYFILPYVGAFAVSCVAAAGLIAAAGLALSAAPLPVTAPSTGGGPAGSRGWVKYAAIGFAAGVIGLSQEIAWTRLLSLIFGPSVYAFGSVLFVYLIGIAAGAALAHRYRARLGEAAVAWNFLASALGSLSGMLVFCLIPYVYVLLIGALKVGFPALRTVELLLGALVLAPLALAQGFLLPAVVFALAEKDGDEATAVGRVFAGNTAGCIVGACAASLVLIPRVGIQGTLFGGAAVGLAVFLVLARALPRTVRAASILACLALGCGVASSWDRSVLASGIYKYAVSELLSGNRDFKLDLGELAYFKEGLSSTVAVIRAQDDLFLSVDGKVDASMRGDLSTQTLLGVLPVSFATDPKDVLVVGLASGVTSGAALLFDAPRVTTVEIEPAVAEGQEFFTAINGAPLANPRHRLVLDDARGFLKNTSQRFDVITSEPSNPWMSGVASLFTREFFSLARAHLREGGIMCQWLPIYGMSDDLVDSVLHTFAGVFPAVAAFESVEGFDILLLGSDRPLVLDPRAIGRHWNPAVRAAMERIHLPTPADLAGTFLLSAPFDFAALPVRNTDDYAFVEYRAPRTLHLKTSPGNHQRLRAMSRGIEEHLPPALAPGDRERIQKKVSSRGDGVILR